MQQQLQQQQQLLLLPHSRMHPQVPRGHRLLRGALGALGVSFKTSRGMLCCSSFLLLLLLLLWWWCGSVMVAVAADVLILLLLLSLLRRGVGCFADRWHAAAAAAAAAESASCCCCSARSWGVGVCGCRLTVGSAEPSAATSPVQHQQQQPQQQQPQQQQQQQQQYAHQLASLNAMGFSNQAECLWALQQTGGAPMQRSSSPCCSCCCCCCCFCFCCCDAHVLSLHQHVGGVVCAASACLWCTAPLIITCCCFCCCCFLCCILGNINRAIDLLLARHQ